MQATSVLEVAPPDPSGDTLHGNLPIKDLSVLMGGAAETRPGMVVVLDASPTLAIRVGRIREVQDTAAAPWLQLPRKLLPLTTPMVRGALLHQGELFLELDADHIGQGLTPPRPLTMVELRADVPDRALTFESHGREWGVPLGAVSQVVPHGANLCRLPRSDSALVGVLAHGGHLLPVYRVLEGPGLLVEPLLVLLDVNGEGLAVTAQRAIGVRDKSQLKEHPVLDLLHMFS